MPNTSHGGGISRKISNGADRKRLKQIMADLNLPRTMGLIVRTAGPPAHQDRDQARLRLSRPPVGRDPREHAEVGRAGARLPGQRPGEARDPRHLQSRHRGNHVEGDEGYRHARGFMKLLMPSHVRRVKQYSDPVPLFQRYGVEDQLSAMYQPVVQLKSGGYLVINPTEALVSIDINSGRSTREHNIEQTAYATNIEAANEIARQLRLRDMAGLVVIDFIDMESSGHIRKVEKAMKEALKNDRARIQVGRISSFGLMEMSRPAPAHRRARSVHQAVPALRGLRPDAHRRVGGPQRTAHARGRGRPWPRLPHLPARRARGGNLPFEQEARRDRRGRGPLRRRHRSSDRRRLRRRADERRINGPTAHLPPRRRAGAAGRRGRRSRAGIRRRDRRGRGRGGARAAAALRPP
jgi:hypothetical protein